MQLLRTLYAVLPEADFEGLFCAASSRTTNSDLAILLVQIVRHHEEWPRKYYCYICTRIACGSITTSNGPKVTSLHLHL